MQKKFIFFSSAVLLALNFFCWKEVFALSLPQKLRVDFLSVGQGDSELIVTPGGNKILIDGGPDATVLEKLNNLLPFWDKTIDVVILTHPESDHMTGLMDVLQKYNVQYFLWTGVVKNDQENKKLAEILKLKQNQNFFLADLSQTHTRIFTINAGEKIKAGNVEIDTLFPFESFAGKVLTKTSNDTCIVARLIYGKNSFLFTGDIDSKAEKELVNSSENIQSDVLKVAHHGSKYSTSNLFLSAVKPKFAVIEVGKNSYGHPTPETLQRLQNYDIKTLRTDQQGDINFVSDGNNIYKIN